jgi:hypothetical protein
VKEAGDLLVRAVQQALSRCPAVVEAVTRPRRKDGSGPTSTPACGGSKRAAEACDDNEQDGCGLPLGSPLGSPKRSRSSTPECYTVAP